MRGLAEKELTQFADRVQTRILQTAAVTQEEIDRRAAAQRQKYQTFVQNNSHFFNALLQVSGLSCNCHAVVQINDDCDDILQYAGLASTVNMQQLIDEGSDIHATRNNNLHTDDQGLKRDARFLIRRGFVEMMKEELPYQCALVTQLQWILSNVHTISHSS